MFAIAGSTISNLIARVVQVNAIPSFHTVFSVLIGANDIIGGGYNQAAFLSAYAGYLDGIRATGKWVICATITPSTATAGFNAARNSANTIIRTWVGTHCDAIADFAADPTMGPDAAASDTALYVDGLHPTNLGQSILGGIMAALVIVH